MKRGSRIAGAAIMLVAVLCCVAWFLRTEVASDGVAPEPHREQVMPHDSPAPVPEAADRLPAVIESPRAESDAEPPKPFENRIADMLLRTIWDRLTPSSVQSTSLADFPLIAGDLFGRREKWRASEVIALVPNESDRLRRHVTILASAWVIDPGDPTLRAFLASLAATGLRSLVAERDIPDVGTTWNEKSLDGLAALHALRMLGDGETCSMIAAEAVAASAIRTLDLAAYRLLALSTTGSAYHPQLATAIETALQRLDVEGEYHVALWQSLGRMPWPSIAPFVTMMAQQHGMYAVPGLASLADPEASSMLLAAFAHGEWGAASGPAVRAGAVRSLLRVCEPEALAHLVRVVRGDDPTLRTAVLEGLAQTHGFDEQPGILYLAVRGLLAADGQELRDREFSRSVSAAFSKMISPADGVGVPSDVAKRMKRSFQWLVDSGSIPSDNSDIVQLSIAYGAIADESDLSWLYSLRDRSPELKTALSNTIRDLEQRILAK